MFSDKNMYNIIGGTISNDMNWQYYVENIVGKASRKFGFIRRNLKHFPHEVKVQDNMSLARPVLY